MKRKLIDVLALSVILLGAATASLAHGGNASRQMSATCESTDGSVKCTCKGDCTATDNTCSCR